MLSWQNSEYGVLTCYIRPGTSERICLYRDGTWEYKR
jgi:hypothetical protein